MINKERFQEMKYWYDSTTAMYQHQYPILRTLPQLNTTMPYDVLLSYIYLDSIARFDTKGQTFDHSEAWRTMNDTLKGMLQYMYRMVDYNPKIFTQYLIETSLKSSKYKADLYGIMVNLRRDMLRAVPNRTEARALYSIFYPDYILRVRVNRIDSMILKPTPLSQGNPYVYRVTADVLDTLKGQTFSDCNEQAILRNTDNKPMVLAEGRYSCIQFQYMAANYFQPSMTMEWPYANRDEAFSKRGGFSMEVGQEAVVFLTYQDQRYDSAYDYIELGLEPQASYNALPIIDGKVRDVNGIWSDQPMMEYAEWRSRFMGLREKILTGSY